MRSGSKAEKAIHAARGTLREALAPGLPRTPKEDLHDSGGKIIPDLTFTNFYVGGQGAWNPSDIANIDRALAAAMSDRRLNNVMLQYLRGNPINTTFRPSKVLPGTPPAIVSQGDVEGLVRTLHAAGQLDGFPLDSTVFNFMLPSGTVLNTDEAPANSILSQRAAAKPKHKPAIPVEDEDSSLEGLGGYHGSVHITANDGSTLTIYYAVGVFSEALTDRTPNGIPFFAEAWKNVVVTFYHELCEARTDANVEDAIRTNDNSFLAWTSQRGEECGDGPMREAGNDLKLVIQEVELANGNGTVPVQFQYSDGVHGPEGTIDKPHALAR
jgi:hypothetical protein